MANIDIEAVKAEWVGKVYDTVQHSVKTEKAVDWAKASGEADPRFIDPAHPDFQAHPSFTSHFSNRWMLPEDFPDFGGRGIDGGKSVEVHAPIRGGDVLSGDSQIADIYAKTGRSGTMVFIVHRIEFRNQSGVKVATVDTKMIRSLEGSE